MKNKGNHSTEIYPNQYSMSVRSGSRADFSLIPEPKKPLKLNNEVRIENNTLEKRDNFSSFSKSAPIPMQKPSVKIKNKNNLPESTRADNKFFDCCNDNWEEDENYEVSQLGASTPSLIFYFDEASLN